MGDLESQYLRSCAAASSNEHTVSIIDLSIRISVGIAISLSFTFLVCQFYHIRQQQLCPFCSTIIGTSAVLASDSWKG